MLVLLHAYISTLDLQATSVYEDIDMLGGEFRWLPPNDTSEARA